tara:strand:- start:100 stop:279 length:180 start_codon:yes stop_codon:yes gene_type:complete
MVRTTWAINKYSIVGVIIIINHHKYGSNIIKFNQYLYNSELFSYKVLVAIDYCDEEQHQ